MKEILLLGGTGAMGEHLATLLSNDVKNKVYITSRSSRQNKGNIFYIKGNAMSDDFLFPLLKSRKWTAIVDFMIHTTKTLSDSCSQLLENTEQYIFISSSRVYSPSDSPLNENCELLINSCTNSKYLETEEYALAKARQENVLRSSGFSNWTIVRPYITYSTNRLQLGIYEKENWLYRALHGRTILMSEDILAKKTTLTHGHDVAKGIASLIGNPKAIGECFNITSSESKTWGEILSIYLDTLEKYLNKRPKVKVIKQFQYQDDNTPNYQLVYDRLHNRTFDNNKIKAFAGTEAFISAEEGLSQCLADFLKNVKFNSINWYEEVSKDRITHECANMKEIDSSTKKIKYLIHRYIMPDSFFRNIFR